MNEDVKSENLRIHSRADELIACLEGEIAKRDETIARLEADNRSKNGSIKAFGEQIAGLQKAVRNRERLVGLRDARILELESAAESLRLLRDYHHEQEIECRRRWAGIYAAPVVSGRNTMDSGVCVTDCRSSDGVAVGIIDAVITLARVFNGREVTPAVEEALIDLRSDEDVISMISFTQVVSGQGVPDGWRDGYRAAMNSAASGARQLYVQHCHHHGVNGLLDRCKELEQSFIRDADALLTAAPAAPAADAGLVEALDYQVLFDAIAAATSVYANGAINISVQAFRDALAARRAKGVV